MHVMWLQWTINHKTHQVHLRLKLPGLSLPIPKLKTKLIKIVHTYTML